MSEGKKHREFEERTKAPLWQWVVVIFIIIAMPLFFAFVRNNQMQRALNNTAPETVNAPAEQANPPAS